MIFALFSNILLVLLDKGDNILFLYSFIDILEIIEKISIIVTIETIEQ